MDQAIFSISKLISWELANKYFTDELPYFDCIIEFLKQQIENINPQSLDEWPLYSETNPFLGELGFAKEIEPDYDLVCMMGVMNAIIWDLWNNCTDYDRKAISSRPERIFEKMNTPKHMRDFIREAVVRLYGPASEEIRNRKSEFYLYVTHDDSGKVRERTIVKWFKTKDWKLWMRKTGSVIDIYFKGNKILENSRKKNQIQLKEAFFFLAQEPGKARTYNELIDALTLHNEYDRVRTLIGRLRNELDKVDPELVNHIKTVESGYQFDPFDLTFCIAELDKPAS